MAKDITEEDVRKAVAQVMHPAIDRTLIDLGMIKDITVGDNLATLTLALPFPEIPIKEYLINSVREPITKLGIEVEIKITVMSQQEREAFLAMEQESWKL
jgi:metal-sulfur cluster biosynthetic enzyme